MKLITNIRRKLLLMDISQKRPQKSVKSQATCGNLTIQEPQETDFRFANKVRIPRGRITLADIYDQSWEMPTTVGKAVSI